jgi:hypothetical protein
VPTGAINGTNTAFSVAAAPSPASSLELYRNGLLLRQTSDYLISGSSITFLVASTPQSGDLLSAYYRFVTAVNPQGSLTPPQVVCSGVGTNTSTTASTSLGTCTLPAGLLGTGDRLGVQFQYAHTGSSTAFTGEVRIGASTVLSRSGTAQETALVGHTDFGISAGSQVYDTQSWGSALSLATLVGTVAENITQALTIDFRGQIAAASLDVLTLRNFTVVRYPAQTSP